MGLALPVVTIAVTAIVLSQAFHIESNDLSSVQGSNQITPVSFAERQLRRKRQARGGGARRPNPTSNLAYDQNGNKIMNIPVPECYEEGTVLMQGRDNYFVKCIANNKYGGFYRVIYLCPTELRSVADTSQCVPPPDCTACSGDTGGSGGNEDLGFDGLV